MDPIGTSTFNSAMQFMDELSGIRRQLHVARWENNYKARFEALVSHFVALSARMKDDQLKEHQELYQKVCEFHDKFLMKSDKRLPASALVILDIWEVKLRKTENDLGLLVKSVSDPGLAIGGVI